MIKWFVAIFLILLIAKQAFAQASFSNTNYNSFSIIWENDVFLHTDYYYSQGLGFEYKHSAFKKNPVNYILLSLGSNSNEFYSVSLHQHVFTPTDIRDSIIRLDDRPYCGLLFLRSEKTSLNKEKRLQLNSSFDIGVRGPWSGAQQVQYYYHLIGDIMLPNGWEYQMSNFPMFNYNLSLQKQVWEVPKYLEFNAYSQARTGTIYNDLLAGIFSRFGYFNPYYSSTNESDIQLYGYFATDIKFVAFNGTMQGNLHRNPNPHEIKAPGIKNWVYAMRGGVTGSYKKLQVSYSWIWQTPEFIGGLSHGYNSVSVNVMF